MVRCHALPLNDPPADFAARARGAPRSPPAGTAGLGRLAVPVILAALVFALLVPALSPPAPLPPGHERGAQRTVLAASEALAKGESPPGWGALECSARTDGASCESTAIASSPAPAASSLTPKWERLNSTASPSPRVDAQLVWDASDGYVLLFGGSDATTFSPPCGAGCAVAYNDTWIFRAGNWSALRAPSPAPRVGASLVYDGADRYVLLYGGQLWCGFTPCNLSSESYSFHAGRWTYLGAGGPSPRFDAPTAYDPVDRSVVLFGGVLASGRIANDTWSYYGGVWSLLRATGPPPDAYQESMTYDAADGYLLLVGTSSSGIAGLSANVSWIFAAGHWNRLAAPTSPPFLWGAWVAYDPAVAYVLLVGEQIDPTEGGPFNVTWGYYGGSWFPVTGQGPSLRLGLSSLAYDPADAYLIGFGGEQWPNGSSADRLMNDTWAFTAPPMAFGMAISASPQGVCAQTAPDCPAGTNLTRVTMRFQSFYVTPEVASLNLTPTAPLLGSPNFTFVPWGAVALPSNLSLLSPQVTCADPFGFTALCDTTTSVVAEPNGARGLSWKWSEEPYRDQMLVRARWSASFTVTVTNIPFGTVPVDACVTPDCFVAGSGALGTNLANFTAINYAPYANGSRVSVSFPLATVTVEGPSGPPVGPPQTNPPPAPPPPSLPPEIVPIVPPPASPSTVAAPPTGGTPIATLGPVAAGAIAAGFTRIRIRRRVAMGVVATSGLFPSAGRKTLDGLRQAEDKSSRFTRV